MSEQQKALEPAELLARLSEGAMALATAGIAADGMDEQRRLAYERGCALAEASLQAAATCLQHGQTLTELTEALGAMADRLEALEAGDG